MMVPSLFVSAKSTRYRNVERLKHNKTSPLLTVERFFVFSP